MLLAVDIGNTNINIGVFEGDALKATWNISTDIHREKDEYATLLLNLLNLGGINVSDISGIALCSVVPPLTVSFEKLFGQYFSLEPLVVESGVKTGVRIRTDNPREVGADRIVNTAAAHHLYRGPVVVTDFGTATTFDIVSKEGDYLGGVIAPGIVTGAEALFTRAAKLPRVELASPQKVIGTNTIAAMQSGIVYGYVGLVEGIVGRLRKELGEETKVVATGGFAELIARETGAINCVNSELTLVGLRLIYQMNRA
jgi:type III pantothenate kinase